MFAETLNQLSTFDWMYVVIPVGAGLAIAVAVVNAVFMNRHYEKRDLAFRAYLRFLEKGDSNSAKAIALDYSDDPVFAAHVSVAQATKDGLDRAQNNRSGDAAPSTFAASS